MTKSKRKIDLFFKFLRTHLFHIEKITLILYNITKYIRNVYRQFLWDWHVSRPKQISARMPVLLKLQSKKKNNKNL